MEQKCFKELANLFLTNTVVVCASFTLIIIIVIIIIPCVSRIVTLQTESLFAVTFEHFSDKQFFCGSWLLLVLIKKYVPPAQN